MEVRLVDVTINSNNINVGERIKMEYPQNGSDLLNLFGNISDAGYFTPVLLTDTKAGFSVQRDYPSDIRFKPALTSRGLPDSVACIWVVYEDKRESSKNTLIPIRLRIALMSKYRGRVGFDEDDEDEDRPTAQSVLLSKSTPQPMELTQKGGYFFDRHTVGLVDANGNTVNGVSILNELYDAHCKTVHPVKGLSLRGAQAAHILPRSLLDKLIDIAKWFLKNVFGRTLNEPLNRSSYFDGYGKQDLGILKDDAIEIFGYNTTKRVLAAFVVVAIAITYLMHPLEENSYFDFVVDSEVLLTIHWLAIIILLDVAIPRILFLIVNILISFRKNYVNWLLRKGI